MTVVLRRMIAVVGRRPSVIVISRRMVVVIVVRGRRPVSITGVCHGTVVVIVGSRACSRTIVAIVRGRTCAWTIVIVIRRAAIVIVVGVSPVDVIVGDVPIDVIIGDVPVDVVIGDVSGDVIGDCPVIAIIVGCRTGIGTVISRAIIGCGHSHIAVIAASDHVAVKPAVVAVIDDRYAARHIHIAVVHNRTVAAPSASPVMPSPSPMVPGGNRDSNAESNR